MKVAVLLVVLLVLVSGCFDSSCPPDVDVKDVNGRVRCFAYPINLGTLKPDYDNLIEVDCPLACVQAYRRD